MNKIEELKAVIPAVLARAGVIMKNHEICAALSEPMGSYEVDRALQSLRRAGRIRYESKTPMQTNGWVLTFIEALRHPAEKG